MLSSEDMDEIARIEEVMKIDQLKSEMRGFFSAEDAPSLDAVTFVDKVVATSELTTTDQESYVRILASLAFSESVHAQTLNLTEDGKVAPGPTYQLHEPEVQ